MLTEEYIFPRKTSNKSKYETITKEKEKINVSKEKSY